MTRNLQLVMIHKICMSGTGEADGIDMASAEETDTSSLATLLYALLPMPAPLSAALRVVQATTAPAPPRAAQVPPREVRGWWICAASAHSKWT
jgi:hypothetical protein